MAAPLKPWERAGVNSRAFAGGEIGNTLPPPIVRYAKNLDPSCRANCYAIVYILAELEEAVQPLVDPVPHHCHPEYQGQTHQMNMEQAVIHLIEQEFLATPALIAMEELEDIPVRVDMVLVTEGMEPAMEAMETVMEDMVVITRMVPMEDHMEELKIQIRTTIFSSLYSLIVLLILASSPDLFLWLRRVQDLHFRA